MMSTLGNAKLRPWPGTTDGTMVDALAELDAVLDAFMARGVEEQRALAEAWTHCPALYFAAVAKVLEDARGHPLDTEP